MAQIAYAWIASRAAVAAPIVGISKPRQFEDAIKALELSLTAGDVAELEQNYLTKPVVGHA